jgi:acetyl esterase/lipase
VSERPGTIRLPARDIAVPSTVSREARALMANPPAERAQYPALDDLLSDTVLLHRALRRAGIPAELHVTEAAGHGGFMGMAPEDQEILREVRRFGDTHWGAAAGAATAGVTPAPDTELP